MAMTEDFDAQAPARRRRARRIPWRPIAFLAGTALIVGVSFGFPVVDWAVEWISPDRETGPKKKGLLAAFNVEGGQWTPSPPVQPAAVTVTRDVHIQLPPLTTEAAPALPAAAPAPPAPPPWQPRKTTAVGFSSYAPPNPPQLAMLDGRMPAQAQGCALVPGMMIYGTFRDVVRWDLGGQINGEVVRTVVSPERPENVLIPQGATLVGYSDTAKLKRGMDMAPSPLWDHVWWIDSDTGERRMRKLHNATGADIAGVNGAGGEVNQHWGAIAALVAAATVTDVLSSISISFGDSDSVNAQVGGGAAGRILERAAAPYVDGALLPIITTPAGTQFQIKMGVPVRMC